VGAEPHERRRLPARAARRPRRRPVGILSVKTSSTTSWRFPERGCCRAGQPDPAAIRPAAVPARRRRVSGPGRANESPVEPRSWRSSDDPVGPGAGRRRLRMPARAARGADAVLVPMEVPDGGLAAVIRRSPAHR
jgi:hypothetical protein